MNLSATIKSMWFKSELPDEWEQDETFKALMETMEYDYYYLKPGTRIKSPSADYDSAQSASGHYLGFMKAGKKYEFKADDFETLKNKVMNICFPFYLREEKLNRILHKTPTP